MHAEARAEVHGVARTIHEVGDVIGAQGEGVFDAAGLRKHFEVFVLSSRAGEPAVRQNKHVSVMLLA